MALTPGAIPAPLALGLALCLAMACKSNGGGLDEPDALAARDTPAADAAVEATAGDAEVEPTPIPPVDPEPPPVLDPTLETEAPRGLPGPPEDMGCADGTREGFTNLGRWGNIAGCAGGFRLPGLQGPRSHTPQCSRKAGNTSANPAGLGCSVADLCAPGWQVCDGPAALATRAPSGCEEAVPEGFALFFLVRAGASPGGLCAPGTNWQNDVHGCGSFGTPAHDSCFPLDRRLSFSTCMATAGIWSCGDAETHLQETALVSKAGPALGGVLCCRDE